mmetsp:Transcript_126289/g.252316  ORF Transcript_126289/g.252316 Transcript_126289/m.252316 type:complete len:246 (-) Transcript_126289:22-759(-)
MAVVALVHSVIALLVQQLLATPDAAADRTAAVTVNLHAYHILCQIADGHSKNNMLVSDLTTAVAEVCKIGCSMDSGEARSQEVGAEFTTYMNREQNVIDVSTAWRTHEAPYTRRIDEQTRRFCESGSLNRQFPCESADSMGKQHWWHLPVLLGVFLAAFFARKTQMSPLSLSPAAFTSRHLEFWQEALFTTPFHGCGCFRLSKGHGNNAAIDAACGLPAFKAAPDPSELAPLAEGLPVLLPSAAP